jgi:hypothetical protein
MISVMRTTSKLIWNDQGLLRLIVPTFQKIDDDTEVHEERARKMPTEMVVDSASYPS